MCAAAANIYVASEGPCTHKELEGTLHLCTVSSVRLRTHPHHTITIVIIVCMKFIYYIVHHVHNDLVPAVPITYYA